MCNICCCFLIELCQTYDLFELILFYLFILLPSPIAVEAVELTVLRYLFLFSRWRTFGLVLWFSVGFCFANCGGVLNLLK